MSELNNLIPISYDNPERPTVSGRELHEFLQVKTAYKDWFPRMVEYGFTEGEDFNSLKIERVQDEGGRKVSRTLDDHQLTIPMAKELCMIQRNERGKKARQYFLAVEAQWNSPEAVMRRAVLIAQRQNDQLKAAKADYVPADGVILPVTETTFYEGETVFDVLQRLCRENDIPMESSWSPMYNSAYIEGIAQLYEFDCGELSGWMYSVNGVWPDYGCSGYTLHDGDTVVWSYTCDLGRDVGAQQGEP